MDPRTVRKHSLDAMAALGIESLPTLPVIESNIQCRPVDEVVQRLLCLHAVTACAYGLNRELAIGWLNQENLWSKLTDREVFFLENHTAGTVKYQLQVEAIYALAWLLNLIPNIDLFTPCGSELVRLLPNLKVDASSASLVAKATMRDLGEVVKQCDFAYCLHWSIRQAYLEPEAVLPKIDILMMENRRHALEWSINRLAWDDIRLDT